MRRTLFSPAILFFTVALLLSAQARTGTPPDLPDLIVTAPATLSAGTSSCDVVGNSWCAYPVVVTLTCRKNGVLTALQFNSVTTNSPQPGEVNTTWNVNLTPLNLQAGDQLTWIYAGKATSGPKANILVIAQTTTAIN